MPGHLCSIALSTTILRSQVMVATEQGAVLLSLLSCPEDVRGSTKQPIGPAHGGAKHGSAGYPGYWGH
eukprot:12471236-Ditylum_brightwellii.AAC.1